MLALHKPGVKNVPSRERFRGTTQRWTIDVGPLAGTTYDHTFHDDWSVSWRVVAGETQGRLGRSRKFEVQPVRADLYLLSYPITPGCLVVATLDFVTRRLVGVLSGTDYCHTLGGTFFTL